MKKYAFIGILLCIMMYFQESPAIDLSQETVSIEQQQTDTALYSSFYNLISNVALLLTGQYQYGVKLVEETFTNIIQTSFQLIKTGAVKLTSHKDAKVHVEFVDPEIQEEMLTILAQQIKRVTIAKYPTNTNKQRQNEPDGDEEVLADFGCIVQDFLGIVQAPNDPKNVGPRLISIFSRIIKIGTDVIRKGNLSIEANDKEINQYVHQLDDSLKDNILKSIVATS